MPITDRRSLMNVWEKFPSESLSVEEVSLENENLGTRFHFVINNNCAKLSRTMLIAFETKVCVIKCCVGNEELEAVGTSRTEMSFRYQTWPRTASAVIVSWSLIPVEIWVINHMCVKFTRRFSRNWVNEGFDDATTNNSLVLRRGKWTEISFCSFEIVQENQKLTNQTSSVPVLQSSDKLQPFDTALDCGKGEIVTFEWVAVCIDLNFIVQMIFYENIFLCRVTQTSSGDSCTTVTEPDGAFSLVFSPFGNDSL